MFLGCTKLTVPSPCCSWWSGTPRTRKRKLILFNMCWDKRTHLSLPFCMKGTSPASESHAIKGGLLRCHSVNPRQYCSILFSHHLGCCYLLFRVAVRGQDSDHLKSHRSSLQPPSQHPWHLIALRLPGNFTTTCFNLLWQHHQHQSSLSN